MSRLGHSASLVCITAISRLKCIGNGWDINVTKMLLSYVKAPEGLGGDWCLQFTVGDKVKVWTDTEAPARWYYGEIKHLSTRTGTVKVEYPPCDGWPNGSHTIHDMDDGNIQFADEGHGNAVKVDKKVDTNQVLTSIQLMELSLLWPDLRLFGYCWHLQQCLALICGKWMLSVHS